MIPIFLSRPNPFNNEQVYFLDILIKKLNAFQMKNVTLEAKDYNPYESLTCLSELIKRCYGMVIVAFGQYYIDQGTSKKGAISKQSFFDSYETKIDHLWGTSPFCQIEGAIAFGNKLPILILEQYDVRSEGILKLGTHATHGPKFSIKNNVEINTYFENYSFLSAFNNWSKKVIGFYNFINRITEEGESINGTI